MSFEKTYTYLRHITHLIDIIHTIFLLIPISPGRFLAENTAILSNDFRYTL